MCVSLFVHECVRLTVGGRLIAGGRFNVGGRNNAGWRRRVVAFSTSYRDTLQKCVCLRMQQKNIEM
jgi:hypothetical protein